MGRGLLWVRRWRGDDVSVPGKAATNGKEAIRIARKSGWDSFIYSTVINAVSKETGEGVVMSMKNKNREGSRHKEEIQVSR